MIHTAILFGQFTFTPHHTSMHWTHCNHCTLHTVHICIGWSCISQFNALSTALHALQSALHTSQCTAVQVLRWRCTAQFTFHSAHSTVHAFHISQCTEHSCGGEGAQFTIHSSHFTLHTAPCTVHRAQLHSCRGEGAHWEDFSAATTRLPADTKSYFLRAFFLQALFFASLNFS